MGAGGYMDAAEAQTDSEDNLTLALTHSVTPPPELSRPGKTGKTSKKLVSGSKF